MLRRIFVNPSISRLTGHLGCCPRHYSDTPFRYQFSNSNTSTRRHQQQRQVPENEVEGDEMSASEASGKYRRPQSATSGSPIMTSSPLPLLVFTEEATQSYAFDDFPGLSVEPFPEEVSKILHSPITQDDVEVKPDGAIYLPEVKYRKILTTAFGAGGWALLPRGPHTLNGITLSREYALFCRGRFISQARGSSSVQGPASSPAASTEAVRSNALMRCCKDLGIASELWDRHFVNLWKDQFAIKRSVTDRFGNSKFVWSKKQ
jgi:hypothetical protein